MSMIRVPRKQRFVMVGEPWRTYTRWLKVFEERRDVRVTYDRGEMEVMTLSPKHENKKKRLARLVEALTEEMEIEIASFGSMTCRREDLDRGLEADELYWIENEYEVRGRDEIDLSVDPPPDLALEIEISRSSLDRISIYAALRVPEVWRYDDNGLAFFTLNAAGKYDPAAVSSCFPMPITAADLQPFLQMRGQIGDPEPLEQ